MTRANDSGALELKSRAIHAELTALRRCEAHKRDGVVQAEGVLTRATESFQATRRRLAVETRGGANPTTLATAHLLASRLGAEQRVLTTARRTCEVARIDLNTAQAAVGRAEAQLERLGEVVKARRAQRAAAREEQELEEVVETRTARGVLGDAFESAGQREPLVLPTDALAQTAERLPGSPLPSASGSTVVPGVLGASTVSAPDGSSGHRETSASPRTASSAQPALPADIGAGVTSVRAGADGQSVLFTYVGKGGATIEVDVVKGKGGALDVVISPERLRDRHRLWDEREQLRRALRERGYEVRGVRICGVTRDGKGGYGDS